MGTFHLSNPILASPAHQPVGGRDACGGVSMCASSPFLLLNFSLQLLPTQETQARGLGIGETSKATKGTDSEVGSPA